VSSARSRPAISFRSDLEQAHLKQFVAATAEDRGELVVDLKPPAVRRHRAESDGRGFEGHAQAFVDGLKVFGLLL